MRYVSFSLWGSKDIYNIGCVKNSELMEMVYPDWKMIVYHDNSTPKNIIDTLHNNGVILENMEGSDIAGPFWRFLSNDISDSEYSIFRDCDSRISFREKSGVDQWISSGKKLHVIRDHPAHRIPYGSNKMSILAGMWGIESGMIDMNKELSYFEFSNSYSYGYDQTFLVKIYDKFINDMFVHDEFYGGNNFPIKRDGLRFIGERIDINDKPLTNDHLILRNYK